MTEHRTGTREEWLAARLELLDAEKELTRRNDELARQRQQLPWVRIDKDYRFDTDEGSAALADLFRGRSQLLVYHFMFGPEYTAGCPACSAIAGGFNGFVVHLENHDVAMTAVSRAPLEKLQGCKRRMGWSFPWASSLPSDFNYDFNASYTEEQQREGIVEYNFGSRDVRPALEATEGPLVDFAAMVGTDAATYTREAPGMSAFASRTESSTTPTPPMPAARMSSGACTSGSTGRRKDATRPGRGSGAATSTTRASSPNARRRNNWRRGFR